MTLLVDGKALKAHKCIVIAKSDMFKLFLSSDLSLEKSEDSLPIDNCSFQAFDAFLEYLYTGEIAKTISKDLLQELRVLGDKYCLETLKFLAESLLQ